jgi:hypothetical protein
MRWIGRLGWFVFTLLIVAIGLQFLFACDFRLFGFERNACVARAGSDAMRTQLLQRETLLREIHVAELGIAAKPVCTPAVPVRPPDPTQKRAYDRGAKPGQLEVFLSWETPDDVDLLVRCPGGKIGGGAGSSQGPGVCGDGRLDLDANRDLRENVVPNPVEHIVWKDDIPAGNYTFVAGVFKMKNPNREASVPFTMRIRYGEEERVCTGAIPHYPKSQNRRDLAGKIIGGQIFKLDWTYGQPLPDCTWKIEDVVYCGPHECDKN